MIPSRSRRRISPGSLLLMLTFTVSSLALMWSAVSCLERIGSSYDNASEGMAAAQFTAGKLRSAAGTVTIYCHEDGMLDRIVITDNGYDNIIAFSQGSLREALVRTGENSAGSELFTPDAVYAELSDASDSMAVITAVCGNGTKYKAYASISPGTEIIFTEKGDEQ